jgi:septum formation protein
VTTPRLILASASPRRRELLAQLGVPFEVAAAAIDETPRPGETVEALVVRLAIAKARAGQKGAPEALVIGSDTEVELDGRIFGKPGDEAAGVEMLLSLAGRTHTVWSAVAVVQGALEDVRVNRSRVAFRAISSAEARAYWASGEPRDKAGGYAIQGLGAVFVSHLEGSYSGVMGLPVFETAALLAEFGVAIPAR